MEHRKFFRAVKISCMILQQWMRVVKIHRMYHTKGEPQRNPWTSGDDDVSAQFGGCNKRTSLVGDVEEQGLGVCGGKGCMEISVLSLSVAVNPKTSLKNKIYLKHTHSYIIIASAVSASSMVL